MRIIVETSKTTAASIRTGDTPQLFGHNSEGNCSEINQRNGRAGKS